MRVSGFEAFHLDADGLAKGKDDMCASYGHTTRFTEAGVKVNHGTKGARQRYHGIFDCRADLAQGSATFFPWVMGHAT